MTSSINPNLINGAYPVAGQDNSTKGMRDNFTNIKTNFEYAASEITALQSNTVITGVGVTNDFGGAVLVDAQIRDFSATRYAIGTTSGTVTVNYANGQYQTVTTSGSITLAFSNFPAAGQQGGLIVRVTVANVAHTLTLPAAVGTGASAASISGIQGISGQIITFAETGTYELCFDTDDGGATIYLSELTRPRNRFIDPLFLTGSEDLAASAAASLTKTTSFFTTAAAETATLAAGTTGQIKVFSAVAIAAGNMVITVTNAGWKASGTGTITFATLGCGCTLQYTNSKWFCIGNNGCTFA